MVKEQFKASDDKFDVNALLDGSQAHIAKDGAKSLVDDRSLTRYWQGRSPIALEQACAALRARRTETNPVADQKTFPGVFRVQSVSYKTDAKSETGFVYETLALGLLDNLAELSPFQSPPVIYNPNTLPDPDVRLVEVSAMPQTDSVVPIVDPDPNTNAQVKLTRHWPYVNPLVSASIIAIKKTIKTVVNPVASGNVYAGTFKVGKVWSQPNEDGSDDIYEEDYLNLKTSIKERYTADFAEDMLIVEQSGLSLAELNAFLATVYQWAYGATPGVTRPVALYDGSGIPKMTPYPMAGIHNAVSIGFDAATGLYSVSVHQSTYYMLTFGPYTYTDGDGTRTVLRREHASLAQLNADMATLTDTTKNIITGSQESNGLYSYDIKTDQKDDESTTYWPAYHFSGSVYSRDAWRVYTVWVQHFANAQDAATFASTVKTAGFMNVNAISGNASGVHNVFKNLIWRGTMVELCTTPQGTQF
jgi:hypothetical protein